MEGAGDPQVNAYAELAISTSTFDLRQMQDNVVEL